MTPSRVPSPPANDNFFFRTVRGGRLRYFWLSTLRSTPEFHAAFGRGQVLA